MYLTRIYQGTFNAKTAARNFQFPTMEINRPAQKKQPSRKGKKAWRKNINLDEVTEGLENTRQFERTIGSNDLFLVDTTGDSSLKAKNLKPLKADEILARRSAIPALSARPTKKRAVSSKEEARLRKITGRTSTYTKSTAMALVEKDGFLTSEYQYDAWGDDEDNAETIVQEDLKYVNKHYGHGKATARPQTIDMKPEAPVPNAKPIEVPHEGKSYNPAVEAWKALLQEEYEREAERERQRLELVEAQNKIEELISKLNEQEYNKIADDEFTDGETDASAYGKSDAEIEASAKLSVNAPVQRKKKTRAQRNKEKRHEERIKLNAELKSLKSQLKDLQNLPALLEQEKKRIAALEEQQKLKEELEAEGGRVKRKLHSHYEISEPGVEVKLSDELEDCLRRLKPEGNLIQDRFRSLQERGLVETRVRVAKRRRYKQKFTEKWQFKDIKL